MSSKFIDVDGVRTHYFDGGDGEVVVLLHSGEFGACAELSWEYNFGFLSTRHRVIAPDWLGFGQTDKIFDFESSLDRRLRHMARFLETIGVVDPIMVGNSMGATFVLRDAASESPRLSARSIVAISGGGFIPDNDARRALTGFDGSLESMRALLRVLFAAEIWAADDEYVTRRHVESMRPGAWECTAAARLRPPTAAPPSDAGGEDRTPYENIAVPVLLIAGVDDPLKLSGYARELTARIPAGQAVEVAGAAHCAHIEQPEVVNRAIAEFIASAAPPPSLRRP